MDMYSLKMNNLYMLRIKSEDPFQISLSVLVLPPEEMVFLVCSVFWQALSCVRECRNMLAFLCGMG